MQLCKTAGLAGAPEDANVTSAKNHRIRGNGVQPPFVGYAM